MSQGWISLHRQIWENELWFSETFTKSQAWIDLLLLANHEDGMFFVRGNKVIVKRGFIGRSEDTLAKRWKWSRGKTRRFIKHLETIQQIIQHKSSVLSLIEVVNYDLYQTDNTVSSTTDGTTERQQTVQQTDTNNKNNKNNNDNKTYVARPETKTLYDSIERLCQQYNLEFNVNLKSLDVLVERYVGKIKMGVEVQHCISWLVGKNLRAVTTTRIGNWFKKSKEIQKRDQLKQLEWKEAKNNPVVKQRLKAEEYEMVDNSERVENLSYSEL